MKIFVIDFLFLISLILLYLIPKKSEKYKLIRIISICIFFLNFGIRIYYIAQKHKSVNTIKNLNTQISALNEEVGKAKNIVTSSNIKVHLKILISEPVRREFKGRVAVSRDKCFLQTKSGTLLTYISDPSSTVMIQRDKQYEFVFDAKLPPEENIYRQNEQELSEATKIKVPLRHFIEIIRKKAPEAVCTLDKVEIDFFVNNKKVKFKNIVKNEVVDENSVVPITLNKNF